MSEQRCTECAHAHWKKTDKGRLHQSGDGKCVVKIAALPTLSKCMSWAITPRHIGGWINRWRANYSDCPLFQPKEDGQ
jgi:hypothetical protein